MTSPITKMQLELGRQSIDKPRAKSDSEKAREYVAALEARAEKAERELAKLHDGNRALPFSRDEVGRMVREAWVRWAQTQSNPKPSWLVAYSELSEADKEADRQIGEAIAQWTLIFDAARNALKGTER